MFDTQELGMETGTRLSVGTHVVSVREATKKTIESGSYAGRQIIEIIFEDAQGSFQPRSIWVPDLDSLKPQEGYSNAETREYFAKRFAKSCLYLSKCVNTPENMHFRGDTMDQFVDAFIAKMNKSTEKARIVVEWDQAYTYSEIPKDRSDRKVYNNWIEPFAEAMTLDLTQFNMTKPDEVGASEDDGDLPF